MRAVAALGLLLTSVVLSCGPGGESIGASGGASAGGASQGGSTGGSDTSVATSGTGAGTGSGGSSVGGSSVGTAGTGGSTACNQDAPCSGSETCARLENNDTCVLRCSCDGGQFS